MSDLFYVFGIALTLAALGLSFVGLRAERFPGSRGLLVGVLGGMAALVAASCAFAVVLSREEADHREEEVAEFEAEQAAEEAEASASAEEEVAAEDKRARRRTRRRARGRRRRPRRSPSPRRRTAHSSSSPTRSTRSPARSRSSTRTRRRRCRTTWRSSSTARPWPRARRFRAASPPRRSPSSLRLVHVLLRHSRPPRGRDGRHPHRRLGARSVPALPCARWGRGGITSRPSGAR